jgi:hypothetical protein
MKFKCFIKSRPVVTGAILTGAAAAIITAALVLSSVFLPKETVVNSQVSPIVSSMQDIKITKIEPIDNSSTGVALKSEFRLLCEKEYDDKVLKAALHVTPKQDFSIKKVSGKEYRISFPGGLNSNSVYRFETLNTEKNEKSSWAFQTKKTFKVVRTLPRDKADSVPLNSGIEITLSNEGYDKLDKFFEIQPEVKGRFEYHKKAAVFVPEKLEAGTVYTVTIKKGLGIKGTDEKLEQDYVFKFQTEIPKKSQGANSYVSFAERLYNFTSKASPLLTVYYDGTNKKDVLVEVLKYQNEKQFEDNVKIYNNIPYWANLYDSKINIDTRNLEKVTSFSTKIETDEVYGYYNFVSFPKPLSQGHYLVKLTMNGITCRTHIQVNDTVAYISVGNNKTLVWVNSAVTGDPIEGAAVKVNGGEQVKTGNDGIALIQGRIPLPKDSDTYNFNIAVDNKPTFFAAVRSNNYSSGSEENLSDIYWSYLYLDRGLYLPGDTVRLWGMIKPRGNTALPESAVLQLYRSDYSYFEENELPSLESKEVKLSTGGTFKGEIVLDNLEQGFYYIRLKLGDKLITESSFQVKEYTKPAYKIDIKPDNYALFSWEKLNIDVQASFFEGSPVAGTKLGYYYFLDGQKEGTIKCGEDGHGQLNIIPETKSESWQPENLNLQVTNLQAEEEEIRSFCNVSVFPRDTMFEVKAERKGKNIVVQVDTSLIDIDKARGYAGMYLSKDDYKGSPVNKTVNARVFERHWESKVVGQYYDFVNKRVEKKYEYYEVENLINEKSFTTVKGKYTYEIPVLSDSNSQYRIEVTGTDSRQRKTVGTAYVYSPCYYDYSAQFKSYSLAEESGKNSFKPGDKIDLAVKYGGKDVVLNPKSRTLFLTQKNGLLSYNVTKDGKFSFNMNNNCIPNINMQAVYFDGTNIFIAGSRNILYDYSEKELDISVKADKDQYKPGDTVSIDIQVKDKDGKPCAAEVNLSVVDEAFFALQDQYVDILQSLYGVSISSGEIASYVSYQYIDFNIFGGAEGGEGGDSGVRQLFNDNTFFDSVATDENGRAKVSFKVPDNLTSWRITYQGVTKDLAAGNGKTNIIVKLPFFVDVMFNKVFLENDTPGVCIRANGTGLKSGDIVSYEVLLENGAGLQKTYSASGKANLFTDISLGSLQEGDYSVTIKAKSKNYSDAVKKQFKVLSNIAEAGRAKSYKLTDNLKIEGGNSLTTLEFYNKDASLFYETLNSLLYTWGNRVDQKLSRKIAIDLLKKYYPEENDWYFEEDFDFSRYQLDDGGIALLKYDSSNPELSAQVSSLAKNEFDNLKLKMYFYNIIEKKESTVEDVAAAYRGLAALNEPVLIDVKSFIKNKDLKLTERLHLILALTELGDYEAALAEYEKVIEKNMKRIEPMAYINAGSDKDDIIKATSICSVIAFKLNKPEKTALFNYVRENPAKDLLTNFEQMEFVTNSIPDVQQNGKFTYELDGKKTEVTLKNAQRHKLVITSENLKKLKFYDVKGDITVISSYKGPVKDLMKNREDLVKLDRKYTVNNKIKKEFNQSDFITVTLKPEFLEAAPDGYYQITDVLPCGFRYVEGKPYIDTRYYPEEVSGQKVVFGIYYSKNSKEKLKDIVYYARAVSPGDFTADNAIIKHNDSDVAGFADRINISVKK